MPPNLPPQQVQLLINLVNSCGKEYMEVIPVDDPAEFGRRLSELVDGRSRSEPSGMQLVTLGEAAREYIRNGSMDDLKLSPPTEEIDPSFKVENAVRRYDELRRGRLILERIVTLSIPPRAERSTFALTSNTVSLEEMRMVKTTESITVDGKREPLYKIEIVKQPSLLDALDQCPARIRKCKRIVRKRYRCGRFYWAGRDDKKSCDDCSDAMRAAKTRATKKTK